MKKKLSRILSAVMCMAVILALSACGGGSGGSGSSDSSDAPSGGDAGVETRTLKLSHHCTEGDSNDILFNKFAELVKEKTNGEIEIDIYANGQLYGQKEALEAAEAAWRACGEEPPGFEFLVR